jgi:hypothetical protein
MMVLLGAHRLPFATLDGMRSLLAPAALLIASRMAIALYLPGSFSLGGWVSGALLLVFAVACYIEGRRAA